MLWPKGNRKMLDFLTLLDFNDGRMLMQHILAMRTFDWLDNSEPESDRKIAVQGTSEQKVIKRFETINQLHHENT